jgi:hypothetical protein
MKLLAPQGTGHLPCVHDRSLSRVAAALDAVARLGVVLARLRRRLGRHSRSASTAGVTEESGSVALAASLRHIRTVVGDYVGAASAFERTNGAVATA